MIRSKSGGCKWLWLLEKYPLPSPRGNEGEITTNLGSNEFPFPHSSSRVRGSKAITFIFNCSPLTCWPGRHMAKGHSEWKKIERKEENNVPKNLLRFPRTLGFIKCSENCWQKIKTEAFSNSRDEKQAAFKPQLSRLNSFLTIFGSASPLRWGHFEIFARVVFPVSVGSKKWENNPKTSGVTTKRRKILEEKGLKMGLMIITTTVSVTKISGTLSSLDLLPLT